MSRTIKRLVFTERAEARRARKALDRALGFPVQPVRVGSGPWMESPPGAVYTTVRRIKGQQRWVLEIDAQALELPTVAARWNRLTAAQKATVSAALATVEDVVIPESPDQQTEETTADDDFSGDWA